MKQMNHLISTPITGSHAGHGSEGKHVLTTHSQGLFYFTKLCTVLTGGNLF